MKIDLDLYQILANLLPGMIGLLGMLFIIEFDVTQSFWDISVGSFGIIVLLSYGFGHLIHAIGNFIEQIFWGKIYEGKPSHWIFNNGERSCSIFSEYQIKKIESKLKKGNLIDEKLDIQEVDNESEKKSIVNQIIIILKNAEVSNRIFVFNAIYGMSRGIAAAILLLILIQVLVDFSYLRVVILILIFSISLYRMHRFSIHYARELYNQFLRVDFEK